MSNHTNHSKVTAGTILVAMGIIYGDIGTSPLYALRAVIGSREINETLVYGGVSAIFWTLVFQTTIKYVWITLQADNQGEGGIFSLYALVKRYGKQLSIPAMIGATTLLADGIITPPISVASAVEGLANVASLKDIFVAGSPITIGTIIVILSALFFVQRFGTQIIGKSFGPIMAVWFSMLLIVGLFRAFEHPEIIKALNPYYAYNMLTHYPQGFWLLGGVFLCTTGAEALYSDLGHCGIKNIRLSWIYVKTSLIICYLGQASWLMNQGDRFLEGRNPFFEMMPGWFLLPSIVIATLATIIASQALISGSYTLISEAINLNFWPRVAVRQPSESKGQIYIPSINLMLWIGCVAVVLYFKSSEHMEGAYGFFITLTMLMTTLLLSIYLRYVKKWKKLAVFGIIALFVVIEASFFVANIIKLKESFAIMFVAFGIFAVMYIWYSSRKINNRFMRFVDLSKYSQLLTELSEDDGIPKFATHLIYLSKSDRVHQIEERIIESILAKKPKRADVYWFLHINRTNEPYTLEYDVVELVDDKVIKINLNIGFRIQPKSELFFKKIVQDLVQNQELSLHIRPDGSTKYNREPDFKFVVIERFLSVENEFALKEGVLLNGYFYLKNLGQSDEEAFGLDKSDVVVEYTPLVYSPVTEVTLKRNSHKVVS
ncbi:potassium transporter Kup [Emticicia sp. CRIBPO]|uniref:KUP/HAK/KT family potassium transporter n=1 Tax=Emticicia sp. CRIBPO TaxID=2683258 RepID=UPI0014121C96|nr:KUP/HAK/KT family potassium transporter [Emticicia sp. CRIBPO]NBA89071.1 potassium transporter Kup [Emticicia sp. CRIBPO]